MSAQRLGAKAVRRIEAAIGEPVLRGWAHGGYYEVHYMTCRETWPEEGKSA